jgi:predicted nuclease of predicted toxin-antitoxin system
MKLLLDSCVWGGATRTLREAGFDVVHAADWPIDPGDEQVLTVARSEGRVVVTLDKDFGTLAVMQGRPHCGIVRLVDVSAMRQGRACVEVLSMYADELASGAIVTVEPGRVRIRPAQEGN